MSEADAVTLSTGVEFEIGQQERVLNKDLALGHYVLMAARMRGILFKEE